MDIRRRHRGHLAQKNQDGRRLGPLLQSYFTSIVTKKPVPMTTPVSKELEKRNDSRVKLICLNLPLSDEKLGIR